MNSEAEAQTHTNEIVAAAVAALMKRQIVAGKVLAAPGELGDQPTAKPTRKVALGTVGGTTLGVAATVMATQWLGAPLSADCASDVLAVATAGAAALGAIANGVIAYFARERA